MDDKTIDRVNHEQYHMTDDLLAAYVAGACTPAEINQVEEWLSTAPDHRTQLDRAIAVWEMTARAGYTGPSPDIERAWKKQQALQAQKQQQVRRLYNRRIAWSIAASLLVLMALTIFLRQDLPEKEMIKPMAMVQRTTAGETLIDTLPDGTIVTLNTLSALDYPSVFGDTLRRVSLQGEAFFAVAKDSARPFIITANGVEIQVLGTAFNVKTSMSGTQVLVEEGRVRVSNQRQSITLSEGQQTKTTDSSSMVAEPVTNQLYQYYRSRVFVCDNTPLQQLIDVLNQAYQVNIRLGNSRFAELRLSTTFQQEPLDNILNIIALTFDLRIEKEGNTIWLR